MNKFNQHMNDMCIFDITSGCWHSLTTEDPPEPRGNAGFAVLDSKVHVFCGSNGWDAGTNMSTKFLDDWTSLDLAGLQLESMQSSQGL